MTEQSTPWLILRDSLSGGDDSSSPDIILGGDSPNPDFKTDYDKNVSAAISYGADNNVYIRAMNQSDELAFGNASVYLSTLDNLTNPSFWQRLSTEKKQTQQAIAANAGEVAVTPSPFLWPKVEKAPWCLIAVITDSDHPEPDVPHALNSQSAFDRWISKQENAAYHVFKAPPKPMPSETYTWSGVVDLQNEDAVSVNFSVSGKQFAQGAEIAFILENNDDAGQIISLGKVAMRDGSEYGTSATVSQGFQSKVTVTYYALPGSESEALEFSFTATAKVPGPGGFDQSVTLASFDVGVKAAKES